jgi:hypothetical protein
MPAVDPALEAAAALHHHLLSFGPDIAVEHRAAQMRYHHAERLFCIVKPLARRVDVGFHKFGRARSKRILSAKGRLPFVPYLVEVEAPGDVDTELRAWLRESYEIARE